MTNHQSPPDPLYVLRGSDGEVTALEFLQNGCLLSGSMKGTITSWDLHGRRPVQTVDGHQGQSVLWLGQDSQSGCIVSQGRDGLVHQWDMGEAGWTKTVSVNYPGMGFCKCDLLQLGHQTVLALPHGSGSTIDLVSLTTKETVQTLTPVAESDNYGMCMAIKVIQTNGTENFICAGYEDGSLILWDLKTSKELNKTVLHKEAVTCLDFHSHINRGVSGSVDEKLVIWNLDESSALQRLKEVEITNPGINCVSIRKDGKVFATGGWDSQCRMFGAKAGKPLAVLGFHTGSVHSVAFSTDNLLAVGSKDRHISMWGLYR